MPDRSYDDLEDSPVRVVLAVPITVPTTVPVAGPTRSPAPPLQAVRAKHRRTAAKSPIWGTLRHGIVAALVVFGFLGLVLMLLDLLVS